ncbi:MAG TPA: AI-2E family transporter, partial [Steroidobacteraceae bacterium]
IGFALVGLPSPIVFGVVATFASLLPALGSGLVLVPAILALMMQGRWGAAIFLAVWSIGVSFADNALRPVLVARHAPVSSLAVFVGVIGGLAAFGAIGLVLGPLLLSLIGSLLRFADESVGRRD